MICENCRREIGPEEPKCPYCGAENPFALQHEQNMRRFDKRYEDTQKEVSGFGRAVEGLGKKAAILVVLLIGTVVMFVMASINYADPDEEKAVRRDAVKNAAVYAEEADGFLERGEYVEYVSFLYAHELMNLPPEEFDRFRCVQNVARDYYECIGLMEEMILRSDDPEYFDSLDTDIRNFCMYAEDYCEVLEAQKNSEKNEAYLAYILDMDTELHAAMRTYFVMDEEEVREFLDMSRAQKAVKLREVLRHE
ncbi:MAG: hypothetical protein J5829_01800 [Lachnospiraceae bacterium]|nr:hypothetical protein [Lachnospiraceae bacterium]